jgi:hypothetical protein
MTTTAAAVLVGAMAVVALVVASTLYWVFVGGAHNSKGEGL